MGPGSVSSAAAAAPTPAAGSRHQIHLADDEDEDTPRAAADRVSSPLSVDEDDDDEPFVLHPVVRPDLPDTWVEVPLPDGSGGKYFVNHARGQASHHLPDGLTR